MIIAEGSGGSLPELRGGTTIRVVPFAAALRASQHTARATGSYSF